MLDYFNNILFLIKENRLWGCGGQGVRRKVEGKVECEVEDVLGGGRVDVWRARGRVVGGGG